MKKVILYRDQYSYFGKKAKEWLDSHKLAYEDKDIGIPANLEELFSISEQYSIPVIVAGKKVIFGFDEEKLKEVLQKTE